jgi:hypothetical protein
VIAERLAAGGEIELAQLLDRHADGEPGGDDRAGAGAADKVEIVGEDEIAAPVPLAQRFLDPVEETQREHATDAAAIQRQDALRARGDETVEQGHGARTPSSSSDEGSKTGRVDPGRGGAGLTADEIHEPGRAAARLVVP